MNGEDDTTTHEEAKPSRLPIYLSAFLLPGAGQFIQRRWLAGLMFSAGFLVCFVAFMIYIVKIISTFYSLAFDFDTYGTSDVINTSKTGAMICFPAVMATYPASLIDTFMACQRRCRSWSIRKAGMGEFLEHHMPE